MKFVAIAILLIVAVLLLVGPQTLFTVDETELAIVTRFGEPKTQIMNPGLYSKTPFVDKVTYFEKRLLIFDAEPDSLLTQDKKRLIIDIYARGRIVDPLKFYTTVNNESNAQDVVTRIIESELRREIAKDNQSDIISTSREQIMNRVRDESAPKVAEFGIEVIDVRIMRADFPVEIAESIYQRMRAERQRIADRERAEGAEADLQKRAEVDRAAVEIRSGAERDSSVIRGTGEAEAIRLFAETLNQDPEFYSFQRSLEAYVKFLNSDTTLVLGSDSPLFKYLEGPDPAE